MGTYKYTVPKNSYKDYLPDYNTYDYSKPSETYSDSTGAYSSEIASAKSKLNALEQSKPGAYTSAYSDRINSLIDTLSTRKFDYNINGDALYQQYKNSYMNQGKQAMQDTIGQASAMTGGYGNSYATAAGNQAYNSYLDQLNDNIPELYQLALSRYNTDTTDLQNLYSALSNEESNAYNKYRDSVYDYQTDRGYYDTQLQNLRSASQSLWGQNWTNYWNAADRNDTNYSNAVNSAITAMQNDWDNYQWAEEMAENERQYNETNAYNYAKLNADTDYNNAYIDYLNSKSTSSSTDNSTNKTTTSNNNTISDYAKKVVYNIKNYGVTNKYAKELIQAEYDRGNITAYERDQMKAYFS